MSIKNLKAEPRHSSCSSFPPGRPIAVVYARSQIRGVVQEIEMRMRSLLLFALFLCLVRNSFAIQSDYSGLSLSFEANGGQAPAEVKFLSRGNGYSAFLDESGARITLRGGDQQATVRMQLPHAN